MKSGRVTVASRLRVSEAGFKRLLPPGSQPRGVWNDSTCFKVEEEASGGETTAARVALQEIENLDLQFSLKTVNTRSISI